MMMRHAFTVGLAAALLWAAIPTSAQVLDSITVTAGDGMTVPADGSGWIEATVEVECLIVAGQSGSTNIAVSGNSSAFTVGTQTLTISPAACLNPTGSVSQVANLTLSPITGAKGLVDTPVTIQACVGTACDSDDTSAMVGYMPGHKITPDITFPATVDGTSLTFNVTVEFSGNARSMVMFNDQTCSGCIVDGLEAIIREPPATEVLQVTFTPGAKDWGNATFEFRNFSHFLLESGDAGDPQMEQLYSWTFIQGESPGGNKDKDKDSPGIGLLSVLGLLGAALIVRRK